MATTKTTPIDWRGSLPDALAEADPDLPVLLDFFSPT